MTCQQPSAVTLSTERTLVRSPTNRLGALVAQAHVSTWEDDRVLDLGHANDAFAIGQPVAAVRCRTGSVTATRIGRLAVNLQKGKFLVSQLHTHDMMRQRPQNSPCTLMN